MVRDLFPEVVNNHINITRQEVFYFGIPSEKTRDIESIPTWIDHTPPDYFYGIPGGIQRGLRLLLIEEVKLLIQAWMRELHALEK